MSHLAYCPKSVAYRGYNLERRRAYQFDLWDGGEIVTAAWTGLLSDGEPLFQTVDVDRYQFTARGSTFFLSLEDAHAERYVS